MNHIPSYNSSYPLAYYTVGKVYSFYGKADDHDTPATQADIKQFSHLLQGLTEEKSGAILPVHGPAQEEKQNRKLNRYYGVVVQKIKVKNAACIVAMYCNIYDGKTNYYTKRYGVSTSCMTDDKNLMPAASHLDHRIEQDKNHIKSPKNPRPADSQKVGGITIAAKNKNVGGITRVGKSQPASPNIGGITKVKSSTTPNKVGGITRVRNK